MKDTKTSNRHRFLNFIASPLKENASYFLCVFLLITLMDIVSVIKSGSLHTFFSVSNNVPYDLTYLHTLSFLISANLIAYGITFFYNFLKSKGFRKIFNFGIFTILGIFFLIDFLSIVIYGKSLNKEYAAAIINTNKGEIQEFISTYLSVPLVLSGIFISLLFVYLASRLNRCRITLNHKIICLILLLLPVGAVIFVTQPRERKSIYGKAMMLVSPQRLPDLKDYYTHPAIHVDKSTLPQNLVMIVGESLTRRHCSLYEYEKNTNPQLTALRDSGNLYVFKNVTSPATSTEPSLKDVFTTYPENYKGPEWYNSTTIFEIIDLCDYKSYWISNQSKKGLWDNTIGKFSDLCDENYFVGNKFSGTQRTETDDQLLPLLSPLMKKDTTLKHFYTVHLMGSHPAFKNRYPASFGIFKPEDYPQALAGQRERLSEYDNSVLFNDSLVAEIIRMFSTKEAMVIYYSDHGLDVFMSSEDFAGHARADALSQSYGKEIPFIIYLSPAYREKHPELASKLEKLKDVPFNTGNFFDMLTDLLGIECQL